MEVDDDAPRLTLRVSRDGGRTWGPTLVFRPSKLDAPIDSAGRFPPCACPRCRGRGRSLRLG